MKTLLSLALGLLSLAYAEETPEWVERLNSEGSVTRTVTTPCEEVQVEEGTLKICNRTPGGIAGPTYEYFLNGELFKGEVEKNSEGYTLTSVEDLESDLDPRTYRGQRLPGNFNCADQTHEFQCLVCTCFFEARGQSFEEQVRVNRVVLSRMMNSRFPNTACGVVHNRSAQGVPNFSYVSMNEENKTFETAQGEKKFPVNVSLGDSSEELTEIQKNSYHMCVRSSARALQFRDKYFASYYYHKDLEGQTPWINKCDSNMRSAGVEETLISGESFSHNFRTVCEPDEIRLLENPKRKTRVLRSPRPPQRPEGLGDSVR